MTPDIPDTGPDIVERLQSFRHGLFWPEAREAASVILSLRKEAQEARREALEEAAREAETSPVNFEGRDIAAFIRAIKDKQP